LSSPIVDPHRPSEGSSLKYPILFGAIIALVAANVYLFIQLDQLKTEMAANQAALLNELSEQRSTSSLASTSQRQRMEALQSELEAARRQASLAVGQAKVDAVSHAERLAQRLQREQQRMGTELRSEVKEVETKASERIEGVSGDVTAVKSEVESAKTEIQNTIAELKRARGDMGEMSGLIATNGRELQALRELGERNYFEFNIRKTKDFQKVGDVLLKLKKVDVKKNKFNLDLVADDKTVEKKDRTINEPLQFYTARARQPYELVVNEVQKDQIIGYLSTPKVSQARK
jgi:vacuolar-type H+-ATPase subunit I/STV1